MSPINTISQDLKLVLVNEIDKFCTRYIWFFLAFISFKCVIKVLYECIPADIHRICYGDLVFSYNTFKPTTVLSILHMSHMHVLHIKHIHDRSCNKTINSVCVIQRVGLHILQHVGCYTFYTDKCVSLHIVSLCIILIKMSWWKSW